MRHGPGDSGVPMPIRSKSAALAAATKTDDITAVLVAEKVEDRPACNGACAADRPDLARRSWASQLLTVTAPGNSRLHDFFNLLSGPEY